jgi:hypothetical protein
VDHHDEFCFQVKFGGWKSVTPGKKIERLQAGSDDFESD